MKTRVIKSERVQKMVIKEVVSRLQYLADMFGRYSVYVENEDKEYRFVTFADNTHCIANSFITSTVINSIDEKGRRINSLYGVSGIIAMIGEELLFKFIRRAIESMRDVCVCKLRRGLVVSLYVK